MENPSMMDKDRICKFLSKIEKKEILDASEMSISDRYLVCSILSPELEKEWNQQKKNYNKLKDGTLSKIAPTLIAQMFLNTIWWETYGTDSFEYNEKINERMRLMKSIKRHTIQIHEDNRLLEKKIVDVMEGKGTIEPSEHKRILEEQKKKYHRMLDEKDIENRKKYMSLQKQLSYLKSELNNAQTKLNLQTIEIDHLMKENAQFEGMVG